MNAAEQANLGSQSKNVTSQGSIIMEVELLTGSFSIGNAVVEVLRFFMHADDHILFSGGKKSDRHVWMLCLVVVRDGVHVVSLSTSFTKEVW